MARRTAEGPSPGQLTRFALAFRPDEVFGTHSCDWHLQAMSFGAFAAPEHLIRHPFGRIPVMDHGDFRLYEMQAILRYLDRIIPEPSLTPCDPRAEARMNQICGITDWYFMPQVSAPITFQRLVGRPVDEQRPGGNAGP